MIPVLSRLLILLSLLASPLAAQDSRGGWPGDWQTFWATGEAFVILEQRGSTVSGTYQPDNGRLTGTTQDGVLRGTWTEDDKSGDFVFVLSKDKDSFAGRFGSGDWWNGHRAAPAMVARPEWFRASTPQETLRTILTAGNDAVYHDSEGQIRWIEPLLRYEGPESDSSDKDRRRRALWHILDISTFRLWDAPVPAQTAAPGDETHFNISPAGTSARYTLRLRLSENGDWQLLVPPNPILQADLARLVSARGYDSLEALEKARAGSPRMAMMDFILGADTWHSGGEARALRRLNLDHVPHQLRRTQGALITDYLKQTLDRIGFIYWQEIPDDPDRPLPYRHYRHPLGDIAIAPTDILAEDGSVTGRQWRFSRDTAEVIPALHTALEKMPLAPGLIPTEPLSQFFITRLTVIRLAPWLQAPLLGMELWQWAGVGLYLAAMALVIVLALRLSRALRPAASGLGHLLGQMAVPVGLLMAALLFLDASKRLGLGLQGYGVISATSAVFVILGGAALAYRGVALISAVLMAKATQTRAYSDEIVLSLAQGLLKLLIVVGAVILCADVAGLPYEGVLTGLGIGGVALAFAARETVSNVLGGAILLSDRPFRKDDLIEVSGTLAVIETVGLRSTRLRTLDDTLMIVPNAQLSDQIISNWGSRRRRRVLMTIGLTYDTPRDRLETFVRRLHEVYAAQPDTDPDAITIGVKSLGPHSIDIELWGHFRVYAYDAQVAAQQALILDILSLAREVGVQFAFPTQTVHLAPARAPVGAQ